MEFKSDALGVSFTVPDRPSVRKQLAWRSEYWTSHAQADELETRWRAALAVVGDWKCERIPDPQAVDLDTLTDPTDARIVMFTGNSVLMHMAALEDTPKNS